MLILISSFLASVIFTLFILRFNKLHSRFSFDHDVDGIQKYHVRPVPRVGGVALFFAMATGFLVFWLAGGEVKLKKFLLAASSLVWIMGLAEDLTKNISVRVRLGAAALSAILAAWLIGTWVLRLDISFIDVLLQDPRYFINDYRGVVSVLLTVVLTVFAVAGVTNSFNIIDGYNGLAGMVGIIILTGLYYVAHQVNDAVVGMSALAAIGSIGGFMLWNYPKGHIFLGDSGAYFIGFIVAELSILLVNRNPQVSAWFPLLLVFYPIWETVFSIIRRVIHPHKKVGMPDAAHMHQLVYRIVLRWAGLSSKPDAVERRNAMTSPYMWFLCSLAVMPAVLFWDRGWLLQLFIVLFALSYIWLYYRIVRRRIPLGTIMRYFYS